MNLSDLKPERQREVLKKIGQQLVKYSVDFDDDSVELLLESLQDLLSDLGQEDFFGTEGWEHAFGLD